MTATDLIQLLAQLLYLAVFLRVLVEALRRPRWANVDAAIFFGILAFVVALAQGIRLLGITLSPLATTALVVVILALPYALLRLADDYRGVRRALRVAAAAGLALAIVLVVAVPPPYPPALSLALSAYFVVVFSYCAYEFTREAIGAAGVHRERMRAVAFGTALFAITIALSGARAVEPGAADVMTAFSGLAQLGSGLAFFIGFSPPGALLRFWREALLREFVQTTARFSDAADERDLLARLERAAGVVFGSGIVRLALLDPDTGRFRALLPNDEVHESDPADSLAGRALLGRRAVMSEYPHTEFPGFAPPSGRYGVSAILAAPVIVRGEAIGVLSVRGRRGSLFARDDLSLLETLAGQASVTIENQRLLSEVRRLHAEERARGARAQARLASIVESSADAIIAETLDGAITDWNEGAERLYGYRAEEVVGKSISLLLPPDRPEEVAGVLHRVREGERVVGVETVGRHKDGSNVPVSVSVSPIRDDTGAIVGAAMIARDISERLASEGRTRAMVEASLDAFVGMDEAGNVVEWSRQAEIMFGRRKDETVGKPLANLIIPERYRPAHLAGLERFRRSGVGPVLGKRLELEAITRDGREFPVELAINPVATRTGTLFSAFIRDLTEHRAAERQRLALQAINEVAYATGELLDPKRLADVVVDRARELLGMDIASLYWWNPRLEVLELLAEAGGPESVAVPRLPRGRGASGQAFETGQPVVITDYAAFAHQAKGGVTGSAMAVPLQVREARVGALYVRSVHVREIPREMVRILALLGSQVAPVLEVSRLHTALREEQEKFRKAFELNPSGISITRQGDRVIADANAAFLEMVGYERGEIIGHRAGELALAEDVDLRAIRDELARHGVIRGRELRLRTKAGERREVLGSFELVDLGGEPMILGTFVDIAERRAAERHRAALEARLQQSERLESLGRLAGGVAHDLNNILAIVANYADFVAERFREGDGARDDVTQIQRAAERGATFTKQLLTFARRGPVQPVELRLDQLLVELRSMLARALPENIRFDLNVGPDVWSVLADRGQIEQVVLNLVVNAGDAMPDGGRLVLEAANAEYDEATALQHADLPPGRYVLLTVADSGHGMSKEVLARAFEPFFTTKPKGKGTGLGLATVYGVVQQARGRVSIYSEVGHGTSVRVLLPAIVATTPVAVAQARPVVPVRRGAVILLAEDEEGVRHAAQRILTSSGYEVLVAADGHAALELSAAHLGRIDLLLTDMVMPGMSGRELSRALRASRPDVRVVFMSGYAEDIVTAGGELDGPLLSKPFTREPLLAVVGAVLEGSRA